MISISALSQSYLISKSVPDNFFAQLYSFKPSITLPGVTEGKYLGAIENTGRQMVD